MSRVRVPPHPTLTSTAVTLAARACSPRAAQAEAKAAAEETKDSAPRPKRKPRLQKDPDGIPFDSVSGRKLKPTEYKTLLRAKQILEAAAASKQREAEEKEAAEAAEKAAAEAAAAPAAEEEKGDEDDGLEEAFPSVGDDADEMAGMGPDAVAVQIGDADPDDSLSVDSSSSSESDDEDEAKRVADGEIPEDEFDDTPKYLKGRQILEDSVEDLLQTTPFETYPIMRGQTIGGDPFDEGLQSVGTFKGLIRVVFKKDAPPLFDLDSLLMPQQYRVRVYVLKGSSIMVIPRACPLLLCTC